MNHKLATLPLIQAVLLPHIPFPSIWSVSSIISENVNSTREEYSHKSSTSIGNFQFNVHH